MSSIAQNEANELIMNQVNYIRVQLLLLIPMAQKMKSYMTHIDHSLFVISPHPDQTIYDVTFADSFLHGIRKKTTERPNRCCQ